MSFCSSLHGVKYGLWLWRLVLIDWVSPQGVFCPDIWIFFLNDKKRAPVGFFFHRVENQLKRSNQLAPKHSLRFEVEETAFKWRIMDSLISGTEGTHSPCFLGFSPSPFYVISYSSNLANVRPEPTPPLRKVWKTSWPLPNLSLFHVFIVSDLSVPITSCSLSVTWQDGRIAAVIRKQPACQNVWM